MYNSMSNLSATRKAEHYTTRDSSSYLYLIDSTGYLRPEQRPAAPEGARFAS
jgi:hypothetical protein